MTLTFTFGAHTAVVEHAREVKFSRTGTRYPERLAVIELARPIPGFGAAGLVRMADVRIEATR